MNLFNFDLRLQKTVRVLVYPNITFSKDLEKDSYIQVIKKQIKLLNEIRDDLWFYLILTKPNEIHAFKTLSSKSIFMVFTVGIRGGKDYEKDTYRVESIVK